MGWSGRGASWSVVWLGGRGEVEVEVDVEVGLSVEFVCLRSCRAGS
jgi:hypothetical protein